MVADDDLITWSLERVSILHGDPTDEIYRRLFAETPQLERLFVLDRQGQVRGNMLASLFDALLDMAGPGQFGLNFVLAERANHEGLGVPREAYTRFIAIVLATIRDRLGSEWTPEAETAWRRLLGKIDASLASST